MAKRIRSHEIASDAPSYAEKWARDLIDAIGKRAARRVLADYEALARNKRLAKADRETASERVAVLRTLL